MSHPKRVLLVYALPHSGHSRAAAALHEELERQGMEVEEYNFQEQWNRLGRKAGDLQKWIVQHTPWFWRHVHGNEGYRGVTKFVVDSLTRWDVTGLFAKIEAFKPHMIIATHMLPLRMLGEARLSGHLGVPVCVVTTDLWAHGYWAHAGIDRYFASTKVTKKNLSEYGIAPARIQVTGIPLRSTFARGKKSPMRKARRQLGLSEKVPHVTVVGGSYGVFPFQPLLKVLTTKKATREVQWSFLFGKDDKSLAKAEKFLRAHPVPSIRLLGFTKDIDLYFAASQAVVTKPGGLTTCEVIEMGVPLVLCSPIPGQEEGNADLLCEAHAALREDDPAELVKCVLKLIETPSQSEGLIQSARTLIPGRSASRIAHAIRRFLKESALDG